MDEAPLRRGKPTVHEKWNRDVAILSGDVMLVAAYELMAEVPVEQLKAVLKRFNRTAAEVCEGQQFDMNFATRDDVSEEEYIEMIRLKTSVLLGFALELGGLAANQEESLTKQLFEIGVNLGIGFQLKDDMLDVYGDPKKFGKQVGGDIIENKKTWLMLKAIEKGAGRAEGKELQKWINQEIYMPEEKVKAVRAIYDSLGIHELAEAEMNAYFNKGFDSIDAFPVAEDRKGTLRAFGEYLLQRDK
jgi:geranylgeranyl diphosphate synthase type II